MTTLKTMRHWLSSPALTGLCNVLAVLSLLTSVTTAGWQYHTARCQNAYNADLANAWMARDGAALTERLALDEVVAATASGSLDDAAQAYRDYSAARLQANDVRRLHPIPAVPAC